MQCWDCVLVTGGGIDDDDDDDDDDNTDDDVVMSRECDAAPSVAWTLQVSRHWPTLIKLLSLP